MPQIKAAVSHAPWRSFSVETLEKPARPLMGEVESP